MTARESDLRGPVAIVVGSEGKGLGPAVRRRCDLLVRIPMHGRIDSLNAAVAGSILLYEAAAQRGTGSAPPSARGAPRADRARRAEPTSPSQTPTRSPRAEPTRRAVTGEPAPEPTARARRPRHPADATDAPAEASADPPSEPDGDPPETPDEGSDLLPEV